MCASYRKEELYVGGGGGGNGGEVRVVVFSIGRPHTHTHMHTCNNNILSQCCISLTASRKKGARVKFHTIKARTQIISHIIILYTVHSYTNWEHVPANSQIIT